MLAGKSVVVTGAARGLGAAIAEACIRHGADVVLTDVLEDELAATVARLGPGASAHRLDVTDPGSWDALAARYGRRPDALVNNAGIIRGRSLLDTTYDDLQRTFEVNVGGAFLGIKWFVELHRSTGTGRPGSIVNIASVRGLVAGARTVTYSTSKFGVRGLTKAAAVELGPLGIRVNAVCPGPIETDMSVGNRDFGDLDWDAYVRHLPLPRLGRPVEVGEAVAWLASDTSAYVTGIDLPVDGGLTSTTYSVAAPSAAAGVAP